MKCDLCKKTIRGKYVVLHNPLNLLVSHLTPKEVLHPDKYRHEDCDLAHMKRIRESKRSKA